MGASVGRLSSCFTWYLGWAATHAGAALPRLANCVAFEAWGGSRTVGILLFFSFVVGLMTVSILKAIAYDLVRKRQGVPTTAADMAGTES